jgi:GMP reductase
MRIVDDVKLDYNDVLIRPKRSTMGSRKEVDLHRQFTFMNSKKTFKGIPIIASNMHGVGTFKMAEEMIKVPMFTTLCKDYQTADIWDWLSNHVHKPDLCNLTAVCTGITDTDDERIEATLKLCRSIQYVCIDVANGYSERFLDYVARFRDKHPDITIIAGNVVTGDITEELLLKGADIVKVGIGPGSVCTTRIKTGIGYPQLSAVIECADAAHGLGGHIIADGGCSSAGDVVKAFAGGADFVQLGGMMAGTDEGGGEVITKSYLTNERNPSGGAQGTVSESKSFVHFYGNSTTKAQEDFGGVQNHRTSEGRIVKVPYKGPVRTAVNDILGGLRSGCTYVGAKSLKELSKRTTFVKVNGGRTYNNVFEQSTVGE